MLRSCVEFGVVIVWGKNVCKIQRSRKKLYIYIREIYLLDKEGKKELKMEDTNCSNRRTMKCMKWI